MARTVGFVPYKRGPYWQKYLVCTNIRINFTLSGTVYGALYDTVLKVAGAVFLRAESRGGCVCRCRGTNSAKLLT